LAERGERAVPGGRWTFFAEDQVEGFLDALGIVALVLLVGIGLLAGWLAGAVAGRRKGLYLLLGVAGAVAAPFILAALGVGILAAGSLVALVIVAALGAVLLLVLARVLFD
jgi:uncharacterized membrane protein YeaQ/YmgE (transglycosylase-associated protein family)